MAIVCGDCDEPFAEASLGSTVRILHKTATYRIVTVIVPEPFSPSAAKALLQEILEKGRVEISPHAWREMEADKLTIQDFYQVTPRRRGRTRRVSERFVAIPGSSGPTLRSGDFPLSAQTWTVVVTVWRTQ
jgi:hypothetical protein